MMGSGKITIWKDKEYMRIKQAMYMKDSFKEDFLREKAL
jgi:hypothetical protein